MNRGIGAAGGRSFPSRLCPVAARRSSDPDFGNSVAAMLHDIPARSRLLPTTPITSPKFVYRRSAETDVQATFARARAALSAGSAQCLGHAREARDRPDLPRAEDQIPAET